MVISPLQLCEHCPLFTFQWVFYFLHFSSDGRFPYPCHTMLSFCRWCYISDASSQSLSYGMKSLCMSRTLSVTVKLYCTVLVCCLLAEKPAVELERSSTVTAAHRQYSVQALMLLAEVTVTLLDVVYRSEEKERVIPLLSNILYNVFPYLKNHRSEAAVTFCCTDVIMLLTALEYSFCCCWKLLFVMIDFSINCCLACLIYCLLKNSFCLTGIFPGWAESSKKRI